MKLIPTERRWIETKVMDNLHLGDITQAIRFNNYVALFDMDIELWQFVPTNKKGEVLEDPLDVSCIKNGTCFCGEEQVSDCRDWKRELRQAKSRVIFEGFEIVDFGEWGRGKHIYGKWVYNATTGTRVFALCKQGWKSFEYKKLNDLVHLGLTVRQEAKEKYDL